MKTEKPNNKKRLRRLAITMAFLLCMAVATQAGAISILELQSDMIGEIQTESAKAPDDSKPANNSSTQLQMSLSDEIQQKAATQAPSKDSSVTRVSDSVAAAQPTPSEGGESVSLGGAAPQVDGLTQEAVVLNADVKSIPSFDGATVGAVQAGDQIYVYMRNVSEEWLAVLTADGVLYYVHESAITGEAPEGVPDGENQEAGAETPDTEDANAFEDETTQEEPDATEEPVEDAQEQDVADVAQDGREADAQPGEYVYEYMSDVTVPTGYTAEQLETAVAGTGLEGLGAKYAEVEQAYGVNALFLMGITKLESGNGTSALATGSNNLGGLKQGDDGYMSFASREDCLEYMGELLSTKYLTPGGGLYNGKTSEAVSRHYCVPPDTWYPKVESLMKSSYETIRATMAPA